MPFKSGNEFYNFSSGAQLVARVVKLNFINISCWDQGKSIKKAEREKEREKEKGKEQRQYRSKATSVKKPSSTPAMAMQVQKMGCAWGKLCLLLSLLLQLPDSQAKCYFQAKGKCGGEMGRG